MNATLISPPEKQLPDITQALAEIDRQLFAAAMATKHSEGVLERVSVELASIKDVAETAYGEILRLRIENTRLQALVNELLADAQDLS